MARKKKPQSGAPGSNQNMDLSYHPRSGILQRAKAAQREGRMASAIEAFGAMIQKAKRSNRYDIEAEIGRFVCLYMDRNYTASVQRCVHCLDALKLLRESEEEEGPVDLPYNQLQTNLERALHQAMVMRGASLFELARHFWKVHEGEYYLLKRPMGIIDSFLAAWWSLRNPIRIGPDYLQEVIPFFSQRIIDFYEAAGDLEQSIDEAEGKGDEEEEDEDDAAAAPASGGGGAPPAAAQRHAAYLLATEKSGGPPTSLNDLLDAAERAEGIPSFAALARILERVVPKERMRVYASLRRNKAFASLAPVDIKDPDAARLHKEMQAFYAE